MARPKDNTATLVGLFLFVGLVILGVLILQFGKFERRKIESYTLFARFSDATGVLPGSDVRLGGARIGRVASLPVLNETFDRVVVTLEINEGIGIPRNAEVTVSGAGLLGDKFISVQVPEGTDRAKVDFFKGDETIEGISAGSLTSLQNKVEALSEKATYALADVQGAVARITSAVDEFEKVGRNVNITVDKFNNGILSDANVADVRESLAKLRETTTNLADASEKLAPAIDKGGKTFENLDATLTEIRGIFGELKPITEKVKTSADKIGDAAVSLDKGVRRMTEGKGLLPTLVNDASLSEDFNQLIRNTRKHGLLFYRDDSPAEKKKEEAPPAGRKPPFNLFQKR
ncbi:MAG: MlaD family protein [Verrucomicrobiales bacterium]